MARALMLVTVIAAFGCGTTERPVMRDPEPDASIDASPLMGSLHAEPGDGCNSAESYWCADYRGVCIDAVCRLQCGDGGQPRCQSGYVPQIRDFGAWQQCYCAPM